jgi:hypothetical protein
VGPIAFCSSLTLVHRLGHPSPSRDLNWLLFLPFSCVCYLSSLGVLVNLHIREEWRIGQSSQHPEKFLSEATLSFQILNHNLLYMPETIFPNCLILSFSRIEILFLVYVLVFKRWRPRPLVDHHLWSSICPRMLTRLKIRNIRLCTLQQKLIIYR